MSDYPINIFYSAEDGEYIADIPDLKYCSAGGATPEEALLEVLKAKSLWLETARAKGCPSSLRVTARQFISWDERGNEKSRKTCSANAF